MNIRNIRTFVPSKDFNTSKQFYLDLGFNIVWEGEDLITFGSPEHNFFLQNFFEETFAHNFMMQLFVDDLEAFHKHATIVVSHYPGTRIKPIFDADYGRTFHLAGPSGELWHMMQAKIKDYN